MNAPPKEEGPGYDTTGQGQMNTLTVAQASTPTKGPLTKAEQERLAELEPIIERHILGFKECGKALAEVSDRRLYRGTHSTFKEWVEAKYEMTAARAYQLIEASEVIRALPPEMSTMVDNERQARELAKVEPEKRAKVIEVASSKGKITAKTIRQAANPDAVPPPSGSRLTCDSCGETFGDDSDAEPIYECSDCGDRFTPENSADGCGHRCPSCNKFGSKVSSRGCPSCGEGELVPDADRPAVVAHVEVMPPEPTTNSVESARDSFRTWLAQWGKRNRSKVLAIVREVIDEEDAS